MFGGKKLAEFAHNNKDLLIRPVDYTNNPYVIAQNDHVISINSCLEIDLLGQVNADTMKGSPYSGVGGQVDFIRGARMSKGGKSFLVMPSTAKQGKVSRIVDHLSVGSPVTTSRFDIDYVVTEYGVIRLWGKTVKERAKALISIAHLDFREQLEKKAFEAGWLR
jgi:4-hydroxybutyrate CoA-transferase